MTKSTLVRPAKADKVPLKLKGKTIAFTGKFFEPYHSVEDTFGRQIKSEGGKIVAEVTPTLDYLVIGRTRGRTEAEKKAERLNQKQGAAIQILNESAFRQLFTPTRDEAIALLRIAEFGAQRWDMLMGLCRWSGMTPIDLSGINLRGVNFHRTNLQNVVLDGADLRDADLSHVSFGELRNVKLDGARLQSAGLSYAHGCTFHKADLSDAHINPADYQNCNFTAAKLRKVFGGYTQAAGVIFRKADLRNADLDESKFQRADFAGADLSETRLNKCDFTGAILKTANLRKADLTDAKLVNADLSKADLRESILAGTDFTGANIVGANFTGANLTGAKVAGLNAAKAVGLDLAAASSGGKVGPNILELERVAKQSRRLETSIAIDMKDHPVELRLTCYRNGQSISTYTGTPGMGYHDNARSLSAGMIDLARRWTNGTLRLTSITTKSSKGPLGGKQLQRLAVAAWCEACGATAQSEVEIEQQLQAGKSNQDELREQMLAELRGGTAGVARWNARPAEECQKSSHFRRVDLSNLDLSGAILGGLDFQGAIFDGASLVKAGLDYGDFRKASFRNARLSNARCGIAKFSGADFTGASLNQAHLRVCTFCNAVFDGADLRGADFGYSDLRAADLSGADLNKAKFEHTKYNKETRMPPGFKHIEGMEWKGGGPPPGTTSTSPATPSAGVLDFATLMERLPRTVNAAALAKALQMLKADRFQLYTEVKDNALIGVVKSQSDPDLVYSCRLGTDGTFACCTQNLRPCGGLHGKLCKHLLVLLVGLAKAGQLDPATAEHWAQASRKQRPVLDKDAMSETFLRYKGAEAGEVDWRPTETIPEDYYAL